MRIRHRASHRAIRAAARRTGSAAVLVLLATLLVACGNEADGEAEEDAATVSCEYRADGTEPAAPAELPPDQADGAGAATATLATTAGDVSVELARDKAPCTVNSFVSLAEQGYYDDTPCHRLTTQDIFVLQCGDPTGTGIGGPGYQFADELSGEETYSAGTLAMANAGPDTNGSQFLMVYDDTPLPPDFTVFGSLDPESLELVARIAEQGTSSGGPDGPPAEPVTIESVTVG